MAGTTSPGTFRELVSPFLRAKMALLSEVQGEDSADYQALYKQYVRSDSENLILPQEMTRHYDSVADVAFEGRPLAGVERLYRRTLLIEPTTACAAHCRWCLRGEYPTQTLTKEDVVRAARYAGAGENRDDLREILITGGDPLTVPDTVRLVIDSLVEEAPNVRRVRIGTRMPMHAPKQAWKALERLAGDWPLQLELGVNICHPVELFPEVREVLIAFKSAGFRIYNQNPLLRGVNDDQATLVRLCEELDELGIEYHYLFHAIPMRGMNHHRTPLLPSLDLATRLSSSGEFTGLRKPKFAVLSDIGKIVLYQGVVEEHDQAHHRFLLKTGFSPSDRMRWNPSWRMPASGVIRDDGTMSVWYQDAVPEFMVQEDPSAPRELTGPDPLQSPLLASR